MKVFDLYIGRTILMYSLLVMGVLVALFTFITFIDELQDLGVGNYHFPQLLAYLGLSIPQRIYELFPMAALVGTMLGLSALAADSELVVMRASGLSLLQITSAVMKLGAVLVFAAVLIGELVTPFTETQAQQYRAQALEQGVKHSSHGIWMRDQTVFVSVDEVLPDLSLLNLRVFEFDDAQRLRSVVHAAEATYEEEQWRLSNVRQSLFEEDRVEAISADAAYWSSALTPKILSAFLVKPEQMSAWNLRRYISHLRENAQDPAQYELAFWQKLILPFATAVMVILAIPFAFRHLRSGGLGQSLFGGIMLGLGFYLANHGFGFYVLVYDVHPLIGALMPTVLFLGAALLMLRRVA